MIWEEVILDRDFSLDVELVNALFYFLYDLGVLKDDALLDLDNILFATIMFHILKRRIRAIIYLDFLCLAFPLILTAFVQLQQLLLL